VCFYFLYNILLWNIFHSKNERDYDYNFFVGRHVKFLVLLTEWNFNFIDSISKNPHISNFMKIRPVGAELILRTDRHDEANNRFRNFANAPKNQSVNVV